MHNRKLFKNYFATFENKFLSKILINFFVKKSKWPKVILTIRRFEENENCKELLGWVLCDTRMHSSLMRIYLRQFDVRIDCVDEWIVVNLGFCQGIRRYQKIPLGETLWPEKQQRPPSLDNVHKRTKIVNVFQIMRAYAF